MKSLYRHPASPISLSGPFAFSKGNYYICKRPFYRSELTDIQSSRSLKIDEIY